MFDVLCLYFATPAQALMDLQKSVSINRPDSVIVPLAVAWQDAKATVAVQSGWTIWLDWAGSLHARAVSYCSNDKHLAAI